MIKAVVSDLFGVIVEWKGALLVDALAKAANISSDEVKTRWRADLSACETGKLSQDGFFDSVAVRLKVDKEKVRRLLVEYFEKYAVLNVEVLDILVSTKLPLVLLSNIIPIHADEVRKKGWCKDFGKLCFSCEIHAAKPDSAAYNAAIAGNPSEYVFIDDKIENVEGARKLGINAIHFVSPAQLKQELAKYLNVQIHASQL